MIGTMTQWLNALPDTRAALALRTLFLPQCDNSSSQMLTSAGLVINGAGATFAKTGGSASYASASGTLVKIAAATAMPALSGTVTNAKFNLFCFYVDASGTLTSQMGTEGASLAAITWPTRPQGKAWIGFVIINPTGTGNFVGGTTALDDATVVPNAAYVSLTGDFDPTVLV